ncbi:unnamed protein product [Paramecium sonneborni]|uniref:Uncharacterized protein n=1 Tax=Paramecium sonneborni TaxID=65129 RepID=A0A8S1R0N3_9CILI|nr:unnamed protein product [Paramecium sonneborni]
MKNQLLFFKMRIRNQHNFCSQLQMLSYQNLAQNEYQKGKDIPSPSPLSRPKQNNTNQQPTPVPQPFNTLLPPNLLHPKTIQNEKKSIISNHSRNQSFRSAYHNNQINPQEQTNFEKQQLSMKQEGEDLKTQIRKLQNENQQLKKAIDQLQSELQSFQNQMSSEQELKAKFDQQEEMIIKLKSEVRIKSETLQENQQQQAEMEKLQKKLEDYNLITIKSNDLNKSIKDLQEQVQDQKKRLVILSSTEHENCNLKEYIEIYKQQLREKDIKIQQYREQYEQLFMDNKKIKITLDLLNFEFKKQYENSNDQLNRANIQIIELQGQVSSQQSNLANLTDQIEFQKQQIKQLEIKEKELQSTKNQLLKLEDSVQSSNQQNQLQQKEIEQLTMTLKNGKQEYLNQQQKLINTEQEIKKQSDLILQLQKQKDQLIQQCQYLQQELKKKQGNLDQSINYAQNYQIEMKNTLDQQSNQIQYMEAELQKRDAIIYNLNQHNQQLKSQLEQFSQADSVNKNELNSNFVKMKEMHNDLILYEKQVDTLSLEHHQTKLQNQMLIDRNNQLELEVTKLREQLIQQDNRMRNLENELQTYSFNQKLNSTQMPYTQDQLFPNQQYISYINTPKGSFNNQFNFYK